MRNLNNIFKTNNRQAQRKVLDKFDISREDKNKTLNKLADANGGGGSVSKYAPRYFKIDWDKASEDWKMVLTLHSSFDNLTLIISSSQKLTFSGKEIIVNYPMTEEYYSFLRAFSFMPVYFSYSIEDITGGIKNFEEVIKILPELAKILGYPELNLSMDGITEITEDEYYKID